MGTENEEELTKRQQAIEGERVRQAAAQRAKDLEAFRATEAAKKAAEAAKKAAEEAAKKKGNMIADEPAVPGWPDDGFQATPGRLDAVKGALGIGDAAFASRLLNDGRPPAAGAVRDQGSAQTDGAKDRVAGALTTHTARPAMGR
jgi:hypothetical protein